MSTLRRGFKTEADTLAKELRTELGLSPAAPLSPWKLADYLSIPLFPLSELRSFIPKDVSYLMNSGSSQFSAATIFFGTRRRIIFNDAHHTRRQASDIAHELAHGLLGHPPGPPLSDEGCRNFDPRLEAEANWLGPALLISKEAALEILRKGLSLEAAARTYGVSQQVVQMRLNVTGAKKNLGPSRSS